MEGHLLPSAPSTGPVGAEEFDQLRKEIHALDDGARQRLRQERILGIRLVAVVVILLQFNIPSLLPAAIPPLAVFALQTLVLALGVLYLVWPEKILAIQERFPWARRERLPESSPPMGISDSIGTVNRSVALIQRVETMASLATVLLVLESLFLVFLLSAFEVSLLFPGTPETSPVSTGRVVVLFAAQFTAVLFPVVWLVRTRILRLRTLRMALVRCQNGLLRLGASIWLRY
ncbi:MAG TPA: hypothetical protein VJS68_02195 [Thermoplasmata archaeon]|nr:hypothetical protein [Thermoplasmata archaeon]